MVEVRWFRRVAACIAAVGALVVVASTTVGAPAVAWDPPPCAGAAGPGRTPVGAWYRIDPTIVDGVRVGQRLTLGRAGIDRARWLDLDAESFAAGPYAGTVLIGTDDGNASNQWLVDLAAACAWSIGTSDDVVRRAVLAPDGRSIVEFRVDRRTRADLGVWRRPLDGRAPDRLLGPIEPDARFGPTWLTGLSWGDDGSTLVVESCGEVACRYRLLDQRSAATTTVADPSLGSLVGLAGDRLVVRGACRGLPCPLLAMDRLGGRRMTLYGAAGLAVISRDGAGRPVVIHEVGADGDAVRSIRPDGRDAHEFHGPPGGRIVAPIWSSGSGELPAGWVLFGPDGRLPIDGSPALLRRMTDGMIVHLDEVPR